MRALRWLKECDEGIFDSISRETAVCEKNEREAGALLFNFVLEIVKSTFINPINNLCRILFCCATLKKKRIELRYRKSVKLVSGLIRARSFPANKQTVRQTAAWTDKSCLRPGSWLALPAWVAAHFHRIDNFPRGLSRTPRGALSENRFLSGVVVAPSPANRADNATANLCYTLLLPSREFFNKHTISLYQ